MATRGRWIERVIAPLAWCVAVVVMQQWPDVARGEDRDPPAKQLDDRTIIRRGAADPAIFGHGWIVEPRADGSADGPVLMNLPAREVGGEWSGGAGSESMQGVVRVVGELPGGGAVSEERIAWWRNWVYVAAENPGNPRVRRVYAREAIRGMGAFYEYSPLKHFMEMPVLPASDSLLGMAATEAGPVVLQLDEVAAGADSAGARLWLLAERKRWVQVPLPWHSSEEEGGGGPSWKLVRSAEGIRTERVGICRLLAWREGVALVLWEPGARAARVWIAAMVPGHGVDEVRWIAHEYGMGELSETPGERVRLVFVEGARETDDALVGVRLPAHASGPAEHTSAEVYQLREGRAPLQLATVPGAPWNATVVPMCSPGLPRTASGLVTLVWRERVSEGGLEREWTGLALCEVSALTGRTMYAGPSVSGRLVQRPMVQWIAVAIVLGLVGFVVYLRSADLRAMPPMLANIRPADPVRRLAAAVVDYVPGAILVALAQGRSALVMLNPATMLGGADAALGDMDLRPLAMVIGVTILHASVCEWLTGKSLGKFVLGVRVVSVAEIPVLEGSLPADGNVRLLSRPALWQAMARNAVRWIVPMLAVFGMFDVAGRHPGDLAAGTLVVADPNDGN